MTRPRMPVLIPILLLAVGCTADRASGPSASADGGAVPVDRLTAAQPATVPGRLTSLEALVEWGLARHPGIGAKAAAAAAQGHRVRAAGRLPDPQLQITPIGEMAQTAAGEVQAMASITQRFPAYGARDARIAEARAGSRAAEAAVIASRVQVAAAIRTAWWDRHLAQRMDELLGRQIDLLRTQRAGVLDRLRADRAGQADILALDVEIGRLQSMQRRWLDRATAATARLRRAISLPREAELPTIPTPALPDRLAWAGDRLDAALPAGHPDRHRSQAEQEQAVARLRSAEASNRPTVGVMAGYAWVDDHNLRGPTSGDDQWWVGLSVSLPLWFSANHADRAAASEALRQARLGSREIDERIEAEISDAWSAWQSARDRLALYRDGLLTSARQAAEAEQARFAAGARSFTDSLQAWTRFLLLEQQEAELRRDCGVAEADLLRALGLVAPPDATPADDPAPDHGN